MSAATGDGLDIIDGRLAEPADVQYHGEGAAVELIYPSQSVLYNFGNREIMVYAPGHERILVDWFTATPQWERALPRTVNLV